tara:strand:+ start:1336 stop:1533 length:198 start_codon:yes stop_codon:yes gene_type:complete
MAFCNNCDEEYSDRRKDLGYEICLECGEIEAMKESLFKASCTAPAYNKGCYMYISSKKMAKDVGR